MSVRWFDIWEDDGGWYVWVNLGWSSKRIGPFKTYKLALEEGYAEIG